MSKDPNDLYSEASQMLDQGEGKYDPAEVFALFYSAAQQGHADSQVKVGVWYEFGHSVAKNPQKAAHYYSLAADQGNVRGLIRLAKCYLWDPYRYGLEEETGDSFEQYYYEKKAFSLLKQAARGGNGDALYEMASFVEQGKGGLSDRTTGHVGDGFDRERQEGHTTIGEQLRAKSHKMYLKAAELGSLQAQQKVFWYYLTGQIGSHYDNERVLYWADKLLENEERTPKSLEDLAGRLLRAAENIGSQDYDNSAFVSIPYEGVSDRSSTWSGTLYEYALRAYLAAAELGCKQSAGEAGRIYLFGPERFRDAGIAYDLFLDSEDEEYIAFCHANGFGCSLNYQEATRLLESCAKKLMEDDDSWGIDRVAYSLAELYMKDPVEKNLAKALFWYERADSAQCLYGAGMCYLNGQGAERDVQRAFDLFVKSSNAIPHTPIDSEISGMSSGDRTAHGPYGMAVIAREDGDYDGAYQCLSRAITRGKLHNYYVCPSEKAVYVDSLYMLGGLWEQGLGVEVNLGHASTLYAIASRAGHAEAMNKLASLLEMRSADKVDFFCHYDSEIYQLGGDELVAEHLKSLAISLDSRAALEEELPFSDVIYQDMRLHPERLDGMVVDLSSFDWAYSETEE